VHSPCKTAFRRAAFALLALGLGAVLAAPASAQPKPEQTVDMATVLQPGPLPELVMGDPKGVPIVEYGSLTCPHCAAFQRNIFPKLKAAYIDTGKVKFIFREFSRNPLDVAAFILARCVGEDKALPTIDLLFAQQDKWAFVDSPLEPLIAAVRPTGLSHDAAIACLKDQSKAEAMQKIVKTAVDVVKVQGTPTFVIDGKTYGGELTMEDFDKILTPLINK
jgi:protein-disulfide isomerase